MQEKPLSVHSMLGELFCRRMGDKNIGGNAKDGGMACEVSGVILKTLL